MENMFFKRGMVVEIFLCIVLFGVGCKKSMCGRF